MLVAALDKQLSIMRKVCVTLEEKGYAVLVYHLNRDGNFEDYPYDSMLATLEKYVEDVIVVHNKHRKRYQRRYPVIISLVPHILRENHWHVSDEQRKAVLEHEFIFSFSLPKLVGLQLVHAALGMTTTNKHKGLTNYMHGVSETSLILRDGANKIKYIGQGKDQLTTVLAVLNAPEIRDVLCGRS